MPPQRWNDAWTTNGAQDHRVRAYLRKHPSLPYLKQLADTPGNSIPLPLSQDVRAELDMLRFRVHANDAYDKTDTQTFLHWLDQAKEEDICARTKRGRDGAQGDIGPSGEVGRRGEAGPPEPAGGVTLEEMRAEMTEMLQQFRADVKEDIKAALKPLEERFSRLERTLKQCTNNAALNSLGKPLLPVEGYPHIRSKSDLKAHPIEEIRAALDRNGIDVAEDLSDDDVRVILWLNWVLRLVVTPTSDRPFAQADP